MAGLFGPSEQELQRLRSAVESLGTTSVPGLAAALAWRERKTEKLLARELARAGTPLVYDPGRRVVRWAHPPPAPAPAAPRPVEARPPLPARPAPSAPAPTLTPTGRKTLCPACHVPLLATGSPSLLVCPQCGRLSSARASNPSEPVAASPPPAAVATTPIGGVSTSLSDRRSQELFAAWVTSGPIACPKCRTPLRHKGVGEYACPACGQIVNFPRPPEAAPPPLPAT